MALRPAHTVASIGFAEAVHVMSEFIGPRLDNSSSSLTAAIFEVLAAAVFIFLFIKILWAILPKILIAVRTSADTLLKLYNSLNGLANWVYRALKLVFVESLLWILAKMVASLKILIKILRRKFLRSV
jgi:hypothetical protein